jgi:hypothetical protein
VAAPPTHWRRYRPLYLVLAACVAPVIASYLAYYAFPPGGRTNYGDLVLPQRPVPALALTHLDGTAFDIASLRGRWAMVISDVATCDQPCEKKLWNMRQVRLTTGKDRDRVERVFLVVDEAPLATMLLREYDGTLFLRARAAEVERLLVPPEVPGARSADHIWVIDPIGNLMLRWPRDADPQRMKKDLGKLLKASRIG